MTDAPASATIADRIRPVAAGAPVVAVHMLGDVAAFVLGEETVLLVSPKGEEHRVTVHGGGILCAASDGKRVVTGGDDGTVMATDAGGAATQLAADAKRRWIDRIAVRADTVAWSAGKQVFCRPAKGDERSTEVATTPGGLAFAPKGLRLAITRYNGVTLWFPNAQAAPEELEWKGSHLGVTFSPDGRFLVTAMQEPTLHGWRLADAKHMRMQGYSAKVASMDWTPDGKALATSGATQLVIWPFQTKDGPMGKQPVLLAPSEQRVSAVACHPRQTVIAVGYEDGMALLVRVEDGAEILARRPGAGAVTALAWDAAGAILAFGTEDGEAGTIAF